MLYLPRIFHLGVQIYVTFPLAQESLQQQESILWRGCEEVLASLRQVASKQPLSEGTSADDAAQAYDVWGTPEALGRLEVVRMLLIQADK